MKKQHEIDYLPSPFTNAIKAARVAYYEKDCSVEECAQKICREPRSGAFLSSLTAAVKCGLIYRSKGRVLPTKLCAQAFGAPEESAARHYSLQQAFLSIDLHARVYERFRGKKLDKSALAQFLSRDLGFEKAPTALAKAFLDGAQETGLMTDGILAEEPLLEDREQDIEGRKIHVTTIIQDGDSEFISKDTVDSASLSRHFLKVARRFGHEFE